MGEGPCPSQEVLFGRVKMKALKLIIHLRRELQREKSLVEGR